MENNTSVQNIPQVSILIPLYNSEKYISETIESCLNQTYKNIEIIIIDDGSTDNSYNIAKKYESDSVKIHKQKNSGASVARNKAFKLSKGKYIQYLDADDLLSPNKIKLQMQLFNKYGDNIITSCSWVRFTEKIENLKPVKQFIDKDYQNPINWLVDSWSGKGMGLILIWLTPRKIIKAAGVWNEGLTLNDDGEFFCRVLLQVKNIKFTNNGLVYYRDTLGSLSKTYTYSALQSMLLSYQLYAKYLQMLVHNNYSIRKALAINFSSFYSFTYPNHIDLLKQAEESVKKLGFNYFPFCGGQVLKLLTWSFGFKNAIRLRCWVKKRSLMLR